MYTLVGRYDFSLGDSSPQMVISCFVVKLSGYDQYYLKLPDGKLAKGVRQYVNGTEFDGELVSTTLSGLHSLVKKNLDTLTRQIFGGDIT